MLCGVATDDVCVVIEREKGGWKPGTQLCSCPLSNWRRRYRPRYTSTHVGSPLTSCDLPNLQQDESSRRHDQQLEQIKEKVGFLAVASAKLLWCSQAAGSRHTSCEEAPCVLPYPRRKWCTLCSVPVSSSNLLILSFQQFTERNVLARVDFSLQNDIPQKFSSISTPHVYTCLFSAQIVSDVYLQSHERGRRHQEALARLPNDHAPPIITLDEENVVAEIGSKVTQDHTRSGRRRARKLRQRMTARSVVMTTQYFHHV